MDYMNNQPRELDWESEIVQEEMELPHLPDGDYPFQIVNLEKTRHQPKYNDRGEMQGKIPPCNKAILTVRVTDRMNGQSVDINAHLLLHSKMEWKLCEFFAAIGMRQKGEALRMDWSRVVGATGLCKVKKRDRRDGRAESEIERFYPAYDLPAGATQPQSYAQPAYQQPAQSYAAPAYNQPQQGYAAPQQPNGGGFTPGRF